MVTFRGSLRIFIGSGRNRAREAGLGAAQLGRPEINLPNQLLRASLPGVIPPALPLSTSRNSCEELLPQEKLHFGCCSQKRKTSFLTLGCCLRKRLHRELRGKEKVFDESHVSFVVQGLGGDRVCRDLLGW